LRRYAAAGHAVVVVSHRPALISAADEVVDAAVAASTDRAPGDFVPAAAVTAGRARTGDGCEPAGPQAPVEVPV